MTLIEAGGLMFFAGMMIAWRFYDHTSWRLNTMEFLAASLCIAGALAVVIGSVMRLIEHWVMKQ